MEIDKLMIEKADEIFYNRFQEIMDLKNNYQGPFSLIDFGIGEEKSMPDKLILNKMIEAFKDKENHKYTDNQYTYFLKNATAYLKNTHHIDVNENEIMHIIGAKSILAMLPFLFINEGDYLVTLKPSYVILERATKLKKGRIAYLTLSDDNQFYPNLDDISEDIWKKTKILNLNFPHNPTGAIVEKEFYIKAISYAKKYNFIIVNDAAYIDISYHQIVPFLSVAGAKDVGIEIYTLSKSHNMTGFRIGFVAGNATLISMLKMLKNNFDSGQYLPIQIAAGEALMHPEITNQLKDKYLSRMKRIAMILMEHGIYAHIPYATFYLYIRIPTQVKDKTFTSAKDFAAFLLTKVGIMTIPYDDVGHYIRLAMTFECKDEEKFYEEFNRRLDLVFF